MTSELTKAGTFDPADLDAALVRAGATEERTHVNRIKVEGLNFIVPGNDDEAWATPLKGGGPAMVCRLTGGVSEYQAKWFDEAATIQADRPEMLKSFCKSRIGIPGEDREFGTGKTSCRECPFNPFDKSAKNKCSWKGDIEVQPFPEGDEPELTGEEPIYTLTLNTSAMFKWKGPARDGETHFIKELTKFALVHAKELWDIEVLSDEDADRVINRALGALNAGRVAAELRSVKQVNEEYGREWYVPIFTPVMIDVSEADDQHALLGEGEPE
jgi:hypothetical protein